MPNLWFFSKNEFFDIFRGFFHVKTKLFQKNELVYEQPLYMLFTKHPQLFIGSQFLAPVVAGMPKSIFEEKIIGFFHFGMPATVYA